MAITTIPAPAASVCWTKGSEHTISFTSTLEQPYNVEIFLYIYGEEDPTATIVTGYTIDGSPEEYAWTPSTGITDREDYAIYVTDGDSALVGSVFTLCSYASAFTETLTLSDSTTSVTFSSPTNGETWYKNSGHTVSFSVQPTGSTIDLFLYKGTIGSGSLQTTIVSALSCTATTMTYPYTPSTGLSNAADYYIQGDYGATTGYSANFAIRTYLSSSFTETVTLTDTSSFADVTTTDVTDTVTLVDTTTGYLISNTVKSSSLEDRTILSYNVKFYIQDSGHTWVDFTDRLEKQGKYKLSSIGSVSHSTETKAIGGTFTSSISDVVMDNSDSFWDDPSMWSTLKTINNTTAIFNTSKNGREVSLKKSKCRVVIETLLKDGTIREDTVGVFRVKGFTTNSKDGTATLEIESLSQNLKNISAEKVKNGKAWYENRPIVFLIQELLKLEFGSKTDNSLPPTFKFPDSISIPTFDGTRALSSFGRPPERVS